MKFGIHSLLFTETFLEKDLPRLDTFKAMGFDAVEIIPFDPDNFPAAKVGQYATNIGIDINIGYGMPQDKNVISADASVRRDGVDFSKYLIDMCAQAGAKVFGGVIYCAWGYMTGKMRTVDEWKWGVDAFQEIAAYAKENAPELILGIEPVNRFESHFINIAADGVQFIKDVEQSNVRVHLDTFHMIREEDNIARAIVETGEHIGYIHACENQRGIPGRGQIPWLEFFQALKQVKYDGCITIESFDPNMEKIAKLCCIWRQLADSPEQLATEGLAYLKEVYNRV